MKTSKMLIMSYIGDHVWLMTSRQTEPDSSSIFGWKMRFTKPILGLLYGYWSGSSTWIFQRPPWKGAVESVAVRALVEG